MSRTVLGVKMASHTVLGDKVRIYQRANSKLWQASTYLDGKEWRVSSLALLALCWRWDKWSAYLRF